MLLAFRAADNFVQEAVDDGFNFFQVAREEMVRAFHPVDLLGLGERVINRLHRRAPSVLVLRPLNHQLGLGDVAKIIEIQITGWKTQADECGNSGILSPDAQTHPGAKRESEDTSRSITKPRGQIIERGQDVTLLAVPVVVLTLALADAAEIETQGGHSRRPRRPRGPKDHFVVHGAAVKRMRMAHHRRHARLSFGIEFQQRFQIAGRAGNDESLDLRMASAPIAGIRRKSALR
jgi:hypothetical protein